MSRNLGQLKSAVELKDFEDKADIDTELTTWISDGYIKIAENDLPCFEVIRPIYVPSGFKEYRLPQNYRALVSMYINSLDAGNELTYQNPNIFFVDKTYINPDSPGTPSIYTIFDGRIHFNCYTDDIKTLILVYYFVPERMVNDTDTHLIPDLYDYLLVDYANAQYLKREKDYTGYNGSMREWRDNIATWVGSYKNNIRNKRDMIEEVRSYYRKVGGSRG